MNRKSSKQDSPAKNPGDIVLEMVIFDALAQIHKLTGYNKEQMLLALIKLSQEWLSENMTFH